MEFLSTEDKLLTLERQKWAEGFSFIAGVDEVGRGPLAGPVVAAAVVFPKSSMIPAVNDSKQLSECRRIELREAILNVPGVQYAIVEIDAAEIDRINILAASLEAMRRALSQLEQVDYVLVDGNKLPKIEISAEYVVKGDAKSASIAAASILAKVYRDKLMVKFGERFPEYGFEEHKGYGTKKHLAALKQCGICEIHRKSFAPVRDTITPPPEQPELF
ncbi:MAG: ribonuclease HII [Victivallaceae bacterium]